MPAYIVAVCEVTNPNENFKKYSAESAKLIAKHGGKYIIRGPAAEILHGEGLTGKAVIISEFPDMETLNAFVHSDEYVNDVAPLRDGTGVYSFASYEGSG